MEVSWKSALYLLLQLLCMAGFFILPQGDPWFQSDFLMILKYVFGFSGAVLLLGSLYQLRKSLSPFPEPKNTSQLITQGFFAWIRHPIYTGLLFLFLSFWLSEPNLTRMASFIGLTLVLWLKSTYEERLLEQKFKEYKDYRTRTGRFFPKKIEQHFTN